jgi:hypothetical protein
VQLGSHQLEQRLEDVVGLVEPFLQLPDLL